MRKILFKAKRLFSGEWIEGFYLRNGDRCYICPNVCFVSYGDNGNRIRFGCWHEVDHETICQYTGLKDKSGGKIWEGDILKHESNFVFLVNAKQRITRLSLKTELFNMQE